MRKILLVLFFILISQYIFAIEEEMLPPDAPYYVEIENPAKLIKQAEAFIKNNNLAAILQGKDLETFLMENIEKETKGQISRQWVDLKKPVLFTQLPPLLVEGGEPQIMIVIGMKDGFDIHSFLSASQEGNSPKIHIYKNYVIFYTDSLSNDKLPPYKGGHSVKKRHYLVDSLYTACNLPLLWKELPFVLENLEKEAMRSLEQSSSGNEKTEKYGKQFITEFLDLLKQMEAVQAGIQVFEESISADLVLDFKQGSRIRKVNASYQSDNAAMNYLKKLPASALWCAGFSSNKDFNQMLSDWYYEILFKVLSDLSDEDFNMIKSLYAELNPDDSRGCFLVDASLVPEMWPMNKEREALIGKKLEEKKIGEVLGLLREMISFDFFMYNESSYQDFDSAMAKIQNNPRLQELLKRTTAESGLLIELKKQERIFQEKLVYDKWIISVNPDKENNVFSTEDNPEEILSLINDILSEFPIIVVPEVKGYSLYFGSHSLPGYLSLRRKLRDPQLKTIGSQADLSKILKSIPEDSAGISHFSVTKLISLISELEVEQMPPFNGEAGPGFFSYFSLEEEAYRLGLRWGGKDLTSSINFILSLIFQQRQ